MGKTLAESLSLYVIVDGKTPLSLVQQLLDAGVQSIQLRDKHMPASKQVRVARALQEACRAMDALFFMNDFVDVALGIGADGVHIGQRDLPLAEARSALGPDVLIGVSVQNVDEAKAAATGGANYVGVGPIYESTTKPGRTPLGPEVLTHIRKAVPIPQVAISGIGPGRVTPVIEAGATGIAVISAVLNAPAPVQAAKTLLEEVRRAKRHFVEPQTA